MSDMLYTAPSIVFVYSILYIVYWTQQWWLPSLLTNGYMVFMIEEDGLPHQVVRGPSSSSTDCSSMQSTLQYNADVFQCPLHFFLCVSNEIIYIYTFIYTYVYPSVLHPSSTWLQIILVTKNIFQNPKQVPYIAIFFLYVCVTAHIHRYMIYIDVNIYISSYSFHHPLY